MAILSINVNVTGLVGQTVNPRRNTMITTDDLATITAAGYLNGQNASGNPILPTDIFDIVYDFNEQTQQGTYGVFQVLYNRSTGFTLNIWENPGDVLLPVINGDFAVFNGVAGQIKDASYSPSDPLKTKVVMASAAVIANHIAVYSDTAGTINDDAATAINGGNIQAGLSGTAGSLASFPATAANGSLKLVAVDAGGAFDTVVSNSAMGQSSTVSIPDPGVASADFLLSDSAGIQHITSGSLEVDAGNLLAGLPAGGTAGNLILYPSVASNGSLQMVPVGNAGNFDAVISDSSALGQSSTYVLPDPGVASTNLLVSDSASIQHVTSGSLNVDAGDLIAGLSTGGTAGNLVLYPAAASNGSLNLVPVGNAGNFAARLSNDAALGQASTYTLPDPGVAAANILVSDSTGTQHITSGSLQVDAGNLSLGLSSGGVTGTLVLYPVTGAGGSLRMLALANAGDFIATIANIGTLGQNTNYLIPDPANAIARFLVGATANPFVSGNLPVASGTGGLMADSGIVAANVQDKTNIIANRTADIGGAGAGPISVVVAGVTAASIITGSIQSSTNAVEIQKITATATGFDILFSADPGASCFVNYVAFVVAQ